MFLTIWPFDRSKTITSKKNVKYLKNDHLSEIEHDFGQILIFDTLLWLPVAIFWETIFWKMFLTIWTLGRTKTKIVENQFKHPQITNICENRRI